MADKFSRICSWLNVIPKLYTVSNGDPVLPVVNPEPAGNHDPLPVRYTKVLTPDSFEPDLTFWRKIREIVVYNLLAYAVFILTTMSTVGLMVLLFTSTKAPLWKVVLFCVCVSYYYSSLHFVRFVSWVFLRMDQGLRDQVRSMKKLVVVFIIQSTMNQFMDDLKGVSVVECLVWNYLSICLLFTTDRTGFVDGIVVGSYGLGLKIIFKEDLTLVNIGRFLLLTSCLGYSLVVKWWHGSLASTVQILTHNLVEQVGQLVTGGDTAALDSPDLQEAEAGDTAALDSPDLQEAEAGDRSSVVPDRGGGLVVSSSTQDQAAVIRQRRRGRLAEEAKRSKWTTEAERIREMNQVVD